MIRVTCPQCKAELKGDERLRGKLVKCPKCQKVVRLPGEGEEPLPREDRPVSQAPQPAVATARVGAAAPAPTPAVSRPRSGAGTGFGIAALVLGVLAALICWIPFVGLLSIPVAGFGVLFGLIGLIAALVRRGTGLPLTTAGLTISALALGVGIKVTGAVANALAEGAERKQATRQVVVPAGDPEMIQPRRTAPQERVAPEPGPEATWAPASSALRQGDVRVRLMEVTVGRVEVKETFGEATPLSEDRLLRLVLELANMGSTQKVDYRTWAGADFTFGRDYATLSDNFDNSYTRIGFGFSTTPVGRTNAASIYPGKSIRDVLLFQRPLDNVEYLDLELPAKNFGGEGMLRMRIPADMIRKPSTYIDSDVDF